MRRIYSINELREGMFIKCIDSGNEEFIECVMHVFKNSGRYSSYMILDYNDRKGSIWDFDLYEIWELDEKELMVELL